MNTKTHPYYNYNKLLSFNCTYNFLVGGRGLGKTFGAKKRAISDALVNSNQFIYLRRYKTELATARSTFFVDIMAAGLFPEYDFKISGSTAFAAPSSTRDEKKREWQAIGFFIALSTSQMQKGTSFSNVKTIIYDEFIIEKGAIQYLPSEAVVFNNFYSTVDRWQDKTKVFFLANSVSIMNPYFIEYGIVPSENSEFVKKADGFLVAHFPNADNFSSSVFETKFGKFIKDSEYADYAVGNTFADNNDSMLAVKNSKARYLFTLEGKKGTFSVWYSVFTNEYFIQAKLPKNQDIFTLLPERMDTHKTLMKNSDRPLQQLRTAFATGMVWFDEPATRNSFTEIFKR